MEEGVKEMSRGIIFPPLAVTRMIALRVPLGPVTLTRPVGKDFKEEAPAMKIRIRMGIFGGWRSTLAGDDVRDQVRGLVL